MKNGAAITKAILSTSAAFAVTTAPALASDVSDGLKHYNHGNFEAARKAFQRSLTIHKEDPRLHYCLANTLMRLKKIPEAMREYHLTTHYGSGTIIAEEAETAIKAYERHAKPYDREKSAEAQREEEERRQEAKRQQALELIRNSQRKERAFGKRRLKGSATVFYRGRVKTQRNFAMPVKRMRTIFHTRTGVEIGLAKPLPIFASKPSKTPQNC
jgi:tetratricopeptide (TPR) repeat protein